MDQVALGMEVGLGPGHIVLDGFPAIGERGTAALPLFGPYLLWPRSHISATAELLFRHGLGQALGNICYCDFLSFLARYSDSTNIY